MLVGFLRLDERIHVHRVSLTRRKPPPASKSRRPGARSGSPAATGPGIKLGLLDPLPHRGLGQIEVPGLLPDRAVAALAQLDDLSLETRA
ncbi:hypothetical protein [Dactylosporangium sp. CA-092794]|uniref:hypothetical protein n=1 Tax=Dactylosporangium sp. CA-092794 TaxID=3239929 RepID=UPI003D8C5747